MKQPNLSQYILPILIGPSGVRADLEKHKKCTQTKFDIFFLHRPFPSFYKGNRRQNEKIYTHLKKCTQTWFPGLRVFPCLLAALR